MIAERISQKKRERNELEQQILVETSSHPTPTVNEVRFFLNQFRKGDVNDLKYRQALVDTFVNRIYLYDDKMTVLYNTQDSHSDVTIDDLSSSRVALSGGFNSDIFSSEALRCNGSQISSKKYSQFFWGTTDAIRTPVRI